MSTLRHAILAAIAAPWPQPATMAQLRAATGLKNAVLAEHIRALRWKGLVMFDTLLPAPSVLAEFVPASPTAETAPVIVTPAQATITGKQGFFVIDEAGSFENGCDTPSQPVADNKLTRGEPRIEIVVGGRRQGKTARIEMIRAAAAKLTTKRDALARLPLVESTRKPESQISGKPDWIAERRDRLDSALAFLKARCILVSVVDRHAMVRRYWITGWCGQHSEDEVIAYARNRGWKGGVA